MNKFCLFLLYCGCVALTACESLQRDTLTTHRSVIVVYPDDMPARLYDRKIVLVGGVFDLIHYGHLNFLEAAKRQGNYLIVAIEPDEFISKHKNRSPVHTQVQRAELLARLDMVDEVVLLPKMQGYKDYLELVKTIQPAVIAVTEGEPHLANKQKQAAVVGAEVVVVTLRDQQFSTSQILKHMCK